MSEHFSTDRYPVEVGKKFWDNDLQVVQITGVAKHSNEYPGGYTQTWHETTRGISDTVTPHNVYLGRLARYYEGRDAEKYPVNTKFGDIENVR